MAGETRKKILEATEKLIRMKGLARVTTKEIARETGLSEGALYRHFERKEDLFFAILVENLPAFLDVFQVHRAGEGSVSEHLEAIALAGLDFYRKLIPVAVAFLADTGLLAHYRTMIHQIEGSPNKLFAVVAAYIEEEQQLGRIKQDAPALSIAIQLLGPCFQYEFTYQFTGDPPFEQAEREFVKTLVQSLAIVHFPAQ